MKKRLMALALTFCMIISLVPSAWAANAAVIIEPLNVNVSTAQDDDLLVPNSEYYKNLDHTAAAKLLADAKSGAQTKPFVLVWHSRSCLNSKAMMPVVSQYAAEHAMTIYTIDQYTKLGGSDTQYLFNAMSAYTGGSALPKTVASSGLGANGGVVAANVVYPVVFAFDGSKLNSRSWPCLALPWRTLPTIWRS